MSWSKIVTSFTALLVARDNGAPFREPWADFVKTVEASKGTTPYHLSTLLNLVRSYEKESGKDTVRILDHGCGNGLTNLYLLALGYQGVFGINIGGDCEKWNRLFSEEFGIEERRFVIYDGATMPFDDNTFDIVFSQQVIEHVHDDVLDAYYLEEHRVLKNNGYAYHQVPHRLTPYDSHTRLWFVHYFPKPVQAALFRLFKRDPNYVENFIFLRWPGIHIRKASQLIGPTEDKTLDRLSLSPDPSYYDGSLFLRRLVAGSTAAPIIGSVARLVLPLFVMKDTISRKAGGTI